MRKSIRSRGLAAALLLSLSGCAGTAEQAPASTPAMAFSTAERALIERYYAEERRMRITGERPAALYKPGDILQSGMRPMRLPSDLVVQLGDLPESYTRLVVGGDVILVNRATHHIADVVPQVAY